MPKLTGQCVCGDVIFKAEGQPAFMANCHCTDCREVTGAAFATMVFMDMPEVDISGELKTFTHSIENGNILNKQFCPN